MSLRSRVKTWCRAVFRAEELRRQVGEELAFHIESYAAELERRGVAREEALRRARAELGSVAARREDCRRAWGAQFFDELFGDVHYALRMLRNSPGFTAIAVGSLALGIGANTVIFTAARHVMMDRLAVPHPEQLRLLWNTGADDLATSGFWGYFEPGPGGQSETTSFSYPIYEQLRRQNRSLADIFAFKPLGRMTATVDGRALAVSAEMISGNYYSTLGVRPALGRAITDADDGEPGSGPVIVISDHFWTTRFGRSPDVIGKVIYLNLHPMTIVGVNPPGFTGANDTQNSPDVFLPFSMQPSVTPFGPKSLLKDSGMWWVAMMGRLKPGVAEPQAEAALNVSFDAAVRATVPVKKDAKMPVLMLRDGSRGQNERSELSKPIYVLQGLAGFVLLLACANLANLLLARAGTRQREMSVRMAMGAARGRVLRQMLTESLMLSVMGGAAGLALAYAARNALPRLMSDPWDPAAFSGSVDWMIFGFAAAVSMATGLLFGLAPAWHATRVEVSLGLKDSAQTVTHRRRALGGKAMVAAQVSLAMLLLVGAGLFVRTLANLGSESLGFQPNHLLLFDINPPATRYTAGKDLELHRALEEKLATVTGVDAVTMSANPLIAGNISQSGFFPGTQTNAKNEHALFNQVGERFFATMGIPIVAGRGFDEGDTATSAKVAVINRKLAKKYYPNSDPLGQTFKTDLEDKVLIRIVGICGDAKYSQVKGEVDPTFYLDYRQSANKEGGMEMTYEVSTRMKPEAIVPALRAAVAQVDNNLPLLDVRTQMEQIDATMQQERVLADLTVGFGLLALVLASIGIYGVLAYSVSRRTNEIGIRIALGAQPGMVLGMVLREAAFVVATGVILGCGAALGMGKLVASMLYGLKSWDPATLGGSAVLLALVALGASWIPARRAAGVDPMRALRHE